MSHRSISLAGDGIAGARIEDEAKTMSELIGAFEETDTSGRYNQFRKACFDEYIKPFEEGTVYKVRMRDGRGFYKTTDEKVAEAFWQPGNITAARQYKAVLAADPEANAALEAVALDSLRDAAVRDGVIWTGLFKSAQLAVSRDVQGREG